jgi:hypothetical protein
MEELLKEFREWNKSWDNYRGFGKPKSIEEFIIELSKKYKVEKL